MYRVQLTAHNAHSFDVLIYDFNGNVMPAYCLIDVQPISAYVHIRGLGSIFQPGMDDHHSHIAWRYLEQIHDVEQRKN